MSFRTKVVAFGTSLLLLAAAVFGFSSLLGQPKWPGAAPKAVPTGENPADSWTLAPTPERTLPAPEQAKTPASQASPFPLDLNAATQDELEALPGIGPVLAGRILDYREQIGGFTSLEQLLEVKGIGPKKFAAIRELVFLAQ